AWLRATGESIGILGGLVLQADAFEQLASLRACLLLREAAGLSRRERDVLHHGHVREEVERLEDDPDLAAQRVHVDRSVRDRLAVDDDRARVDRLEAVDAAEERRLPRPRRTDQADDLMQVHGQVDSFEDRELVEALGDSLDRDEVAVGAHTSWARSRFSRSLIRRSVKRANGIVRMTKKIAATV